MAWIFFGALSCRKKNLTARVFMLLKSRASPDMLPFNPCSKKRLTIRHMNRPLFPKTLSIPSYDPELVRTRDLSAPSHILVEGYRRFGRTHFLNLRCEDKFFCYQVRELCKEHFVPRSLFPSVICMVRLL